MTDKKLWDHHQDENREHLKEGYFRQNEIFFKISKLLRKADRIIEIGFGDGYLLNKLSKVGFYVTGQDLSEKNIEITKKQWGNSQIDFLLGDDSGVILMKDESCDGFIASEVLEHMTDEELVICTKEIYRVLKKGRFAFITFPCRESLEKSTHFCPNCTERFHKWGHKQSWDIKKINKVFSNFEIIQANRFISIGRNHYENLFVRYLCFILNIIFKIQPNFLSFITSNYFLILKKPD